MIYMEEKEPITLKYISCARDRLKEYSADLDTEVFQYATIKAFEYSYELSFKLLARVLFEIEGAPAAQSIKEVFRQAAVVDLIDDPKLWFDFTRIRNKAANFFDEEDFKEMVSILPVFQKELNSLIERLQKNYTFDE